MSSKAHQRSYLRLARDTELQRDLREEQVIAPGDFLFKSTGTGFVALQMRFDDKVSAAERAAITAFLKKKKPRQFPANDSGDDYNLCVFLRSRGHKVQRHCSAWGRCAPYWIDDKPYTRKRFIAFINKIRETLQLQQLGCAA